MTIDVREVLARAAHTPTEPTDYGALERVVVMRRRRRVGVIAAALATLACLAVASVLTDTDRDRAADEASPPVTLVPLPSDTSTGTAPWVPNRLQVAAVEDGGLHRLAVTLPDGASFEAQRARGGGPRPAQCPPLRRRCRAR